MTTIKIVPDFPGAYGAKVDAWERQKRKEIALMPERAGYRPGIVLKPRPTATITVAAVQVSSSALSGLIPAGRVGGVVAVRGTVLCPVWSAPLGVKGERGLAGASVRYI